MIAELRGAAGTDAVREAAAGDEVHGVRPRAVAAPASVDACAATLALCSEQGWSVEIAGGRTSGDAGRPVASVDLLLSTRRLSGIGEYEPDDLTIGVAAGTTLAELRARTEVNRQRAPLDAPNGRATVGGVLARAAAGPMRQAWSTPRRQTLGVELVTGDGRILRVGGRVVKNVAGYDMNKLIVGSAGTLGVITRAHLRLLPLPETTATFALDGPDVDELAGVARELIAAPVQPAAIELAGPEWRLLVRYEGSGQAVASALERMNAVARAVGRAPLRDDDALARLAVLEADAAVVVRLADLPSRLEGTLAAARTLVDGDGTVAAHAGDGIVRVLLDDARPTIDGQAFADAIDAARRGGTASVIVERAPARLMRATDPWGPMSDTVMHITRELKRQLDPAGILQKGRWIA